MPTAPVAGGEAAVKTGAAFAGTTVIVRDGVLTTPLAFVAEMVTVNTPALLGVPDSTPVNASRVRPGGNVPLTAKTGAG